MQLKSHKVHFGIFLTGIIVFFAGTFFILPSAFATTYTGLAALSIAISPPVLDKGDYDRRMLSLAHISLASTTWSTSARVAPVLTASTSSSTPALPALLIATTTASTSVSVVGKSWPAPAPYPLVGALLPFNRIIAYYGNFYSTRMGVLGEYPPVEMLAKLASTTEEWRAADPSTPAIPAIDYIVVTAQAAAGDDGKYRARMPDDQIKKAIALAEAAHGIVILDVQVGLSDLKTELPLLAPYLSLPQVHLAIDPEFSIKVKSRPGLVVGTMDAGDVNYAATFLAGLVQEYHLPPKVLVVHRFTKAMLTGSSEIRPLPEVQIVEDMDGFGTVARKLNTYQYIVAAEPIQFTGFKLFYKNDFPPHGDVMMTPAQVISLTPAPVFIQYQ